MRSELTFTKTTYGSLEVLLQAVTNREAVAQRGHYPAMFDDINVERPVPSWKALEWLGEDYGLSRKEKVPYDKVYLKISEKWQINPPPSVSINVHFCRCPRRYKWDPKTTLDSIEYNWPIIPDSYQVKIG